MMNPLSKGATAVVLGTIGMVMFAATLPATILALEGLGPVFITAGRAVLAGVLSAGLLLACRVARPRGRELWLLTAISLCLVGAFPLFTGLAMQTVGAGHGSVVLAIMPLATAVAATVVGGERPGLAFWLFCVVGALIVFVFTMSRAGWQIEPGDVFLVLAAACAGLGYASSGVLARTMPGWTVIAWALTFSLPVTILVSVLSAPAEWPDSPSVWLAFVYLGAVSMFLGFVFWNVAMAMGGIAKIGQIQLMQPFVTIAIAAVVTAEHLDPLEIAFAAAVVVVVAAAQRLRVSRSEPVPAAAPPAAEPAPPASA